MSAKLIYLKHEIQRRIFRQADRRFGKNDKKAFTKYVQLAVLNQVQADEKKTNKELKKEMVKSE